MFERLENDASVHGNYNLFVVNADGSNETRLTDTGYLQGLASWSRSGDRIVWIVAAIDGAGSYRAFVMNADGSGSGSVAPGYFPAEFLIHCAVFSADGAKIYFIGEWWE